MPAHADRQPAAQIKLPKLKFSWKPSSDQSVRWHLRFVGHVFRGTPRVLYLFVSVQGLLLWSAALLVAAYFVGSLSLYYLWSRNSYNPVTYADVVLPYRWPELRAKRGTGMIDEGIHDLRSGRFTSGFFLLNRGVALQPADIRGRMVLAQAYINLGLVHRSIQILEEGLDYGPPSRNYREALFRLATYLEDFERIITLADRLESTLPAGDTSSRRWLQGQRAVAWEKLHRLDEIDRLRQQLASPNSLVEAAWARMQATEGDPAAALQAIAHDPGRFGVVSDRCQLQLTLAVAAHDPAAADAAIREWLVGEPTQALPRIEEIMALIHLQALPRAEDRLQRFFLHFGAEHTALLMLMKRLSEEPDSTWLQRAYQEAETTGAVTIDLRILHVQGLMTAGRIPEAQAAFAQAEAILAAKKISDGGWSEATRRLLAVLTGYSPSNQSLLFDFFRTQRLNPAAYRFALRTLRRAGAHAIADELAILARNRFPALQDAAPSGAPTQPQMAIATVKPRTDLEARSELRLIDQAIQREDLALAFEKLKSLERSPSGTLKADLSLRRIQVLGGMDQQHDLAAAVQHYLTGTAVDQSRLRQLALDWKQNHSESANTLAQEIAARFPQARWAQEWAGIPAKTDPGVVSTTATPQKTNLRQIDALLRERRYSSALEQVKSLEHQQRDAGMRTELLLRRIQIYGALREQTELVATLGYYLSGNDVNQSTLRSLALEWDNDQQCDSALSVVREVLARYPQARWAVELRRKLEGGLLVAPDSSGQ